MRLNIKINNDALELAFQRAGILGEQIRDEYAAFVESYERAKTAVAKQRIGQKGDNCQTND
jgi:hypothetical protein